MNRMVDFDRQSTNVTPQVTPYVQIAGITPDAVHLPADNGRVYLDDTPLTGAGDTEEERAVNLRDAFLRAAELLQDRIEDRSTANTRRCTTCGEPTGDQQARWCSTTCFDEDHNIAQVES